MKTNKIPYNKLTNEDKQKIIDSYYLYKDLKFKELAELCETADNIIDNILEEDYIEEITKCPVYIIAGNNDLFSYLPTEREIRIGKYKVLMTHGHGYYVSRDTKSLRRAATARGIDIVMFGHTHRPYLDVEGELMVINPGSLSYPRQEGRKPSFIIMEIDDGGEAHFTINYIS